MKKILLIHTGGTLGMMPMDPGEMLAPGNFQNEILEIVPEINRLANIEVRIPFNLDSSDIGHKEWDLLAKMIYDSKDEFDGFVIIHGTDTMVYTAAALSFSLLNFPSPVVLTGAQRPLSKLRTDARSNLIDAVQLAAMNISEVIIVFGQRVLRGNRAKKLSTNSYLAFDSPNYPHLGEIGVTIDLDRKQCRKQQGKFIFRPGFDSRVLVFPVHPSTYIECLYSLIDSPVQALILQGFGVGNIPATADADWIALIRRFTEAGKIVFMTSHSLRGGIDLGLYQSGQQALKAGAQSMGKMTVEAGFVKMQKILTMSSDRDEIIRLFSEDWAGENQ